MTHSLYDKISAARLTAAVLYDRGRAMERSHEQLEQDIAPLREKIVAIEREAAREDLPGAISAVRMLESEARKLDQDAKFIAEKAADTRAHAERLKRAIRADLEARGLTERIESGFSVTLVGQELTLR